MFRNTNGASQETGKPLVMLPLVILDCLLPFIDFSIKTMPIFIFFSAAYLLAFFPMQISIMRLCSYSVSFIELKKCK